MSAFLTGLMALSIKATLVVAVVMAVQFLMRRWLPAGFRFALWALVGLRLLVPRLPESPVSILRTTPVLEPAAVIPGLAPWISGGSSAAPIVGSASPSLGAEFWLLAIWVVGTAILLARWAVGHRKIHSLVKQATPVQAESVQRILVSCRAAMRIERPVQLLETPAIESPAIYGSRRPVILVPKDFCRRWSADQQRNVLLHELAHLERNDGIWLHLAHILVACHWFNPVMWLAVSRFRSDLEMACDATVLAYLEAAERADYGKTLLEVGVQPLVGLPRPCFAVNSTHQLKRRILMISRFRSRSWRRNALLTVLAITLILVTLTEIPTSLAWATGNPDVDAEALAQEIAVRLDGNGQTPRQTAASITQLLEGTNIPLENLDRALRTQVTQMRQAGNGENAHTLVTLADLWRREHGVQPSLASDEDQLPRTVEQLRNLGTVMYYEHLTPAIGDLHATRSYQAPTSFRWQDCPAISHQQLQELLGPSVDVAELDAWGGALEFCFDTEFDRPHGLIGIRSPGSDGRFDNDTYTIGGFPASQTGHDIVWIDGYFARWPES